MDPTNTNIDSNISSSNEGSHFFEGVEKLLEVWFSKKDKKTRNCDLRKIPRAELDALLEIVQCTIISERKNDIIDSYVLSESSMFITKNRFILKTCGTTTPLKCLSHLIGLVETYSGYNDIEDLYYSRKNYKRPELQRMPHRSFNEEAALLDELFPDGAAYCFGSVNRDCWYLYTLNPVLPAEVLRRVSSGGSLSDGQSDTESIESDGSENSDDSGIVAWLESGTRGLTECQDRDHTIEILMTNLDPELMKIFTKECSKTAAEATEKSGIDRIIPGCVIDDYLFDPCGYSMNGILKTGEYMTIHITPEKEFSYVSFESNISHDCYRAVIQRVLDTFRPGKFVVTAFACKGLDGDKTHKEITTYTLGEDYLRRDLQYCQLKNYDLTYALYSKFPS